MSTRTLGLDDALHEYLLSVSVHEDEIAQELRARTARMPESNMQISPEQGRFMELLLRLINASRVIEIGTYTGYSALCMARAIGARGRLVCLDINEEWTAVAREYWQRAGVAERIDLRIAPACESLDRMLDAGEAGTYDFGFIDADKKGYPEYYERLLTLLRPGGLIAIDNTLWSGRVADPTEQDDNTSAIRAFNERLYDDDRVLMSLVPIGDGLTLARKH